MTDLGRILPVLEPPPHGLPQLRARLDARRAPRWPWAVALGLALAALIAGRPRPEPLERDAGLLAWDGSPREAVSIPPGAEGEVALERVPAEVVWYRVDGVRR